MVLSPDSNPSLGWVNYGLCGLESPSPSLAQKPNTESFFEPQSAQEPITLVMIPRQEQLYIGVNINGRVDRGKTALSLNK